MDTTLGTAVSDVGVAAAATVRAAVARDRLAVEALVRAADLPAGVTGVLETGGLLVAESAEGIVGTAGLEVHGGDGLIRSVAVAPDWRNRGVGERLVRAVTDRARGLGLRRLYLLTTTASSWFARLGFAPVDRAHVPEEVQRSTEFSELCPASAAVMMRELRAPRVSCCGGSTPTLVGIGVDAGVDISDPAALKAEVRQRYGDAALSARSGGVASCCGSGSATRDPITSDLYEAAETSGLPAEAMLASLGCGNPTALAQLEPGQTVLDLGSGGGIDVLLSARRVGPAGKVYGLDMTDEMLELARANQARAGVTNVEFLKGDIEAIPLPDDSVDVIISNCVINLAADKSQVLREAFRVLRPGGRFAVSDIVTRGDVPETIRRSMSLWVGCIAGALREDEYLEQLDAAGFSDISLEPTRVYGSADARQMLSDAGVPEPDDLDEFDGAFFSAFVRAVKP
jgi:arsenite methyltransferase